MRHALLAVLLWAAAAHPAFAESKGCNIDLGEIRKEIQESRQELEKLRKSGAVVPPAAQEESSEDLAELIKELKESREELRKIAEKKGLPEDTREELQKLTIDSIGRQLPVFVQDALPSKGLLFALAFYGYNGADRNQWTMQPFLTWGPTDRFELGAGIDGGFDDGVPVGLPVRLHAQALLLPPKGLRPSIAVDAEFATQGHPEPMHLDGLLLVTQPIGEFRVHVNLGYRWVDRASDRIFAGLAADHPFGERTRAIVDVWDLPAIHASSYDLGTDLGLIVAITAHLGVQATAGILWEDGKVVPRLLSAFIFES